MAISIILCFFFLFPSFSSSFNQPSCHPHDYSALLQFSNSFSLNHSASSECDEFFDGYYTYTIKNTSYPKTTSWGNVSNCCLWDGVTCNSMAGHVIGLDLSCSWLYGQLHPNSTLFQLSHLQTLNLAHNHFNGSSISSHFGDLSSLTHLNLSESVFAAEIPPKISHLSKLTSLDLSWNDELKLKPSTWEKLILNMTDLRELVLDGINMSSITLSSLSLLMNLSSSLVSLRLHNTRLQGNITSDIFILQNLEHLDLSENENLKIQLPISNWSSPLRYLDLSYITFSGEVPNSIGHLEYLTHLNLHSCGFEGPIPLGFRNLTQLTYLNLDSNKFSGDILYFSNIASLAYLDLSYNFLNGTIPHFSNVGNGSLTYSDLSHDNLTSVEFLSNMNLRYLDLNFNMLQGNIPSTLCKASSLKILTLSHNNLSGPIPQCLVALPDLLVLDLQKNRLVGSMPCNISKNNRLQTVNLNNNQLEGPLPRSLAYCNQLRVLDVGYNKIEDSFPYWLGGLPELQVLVLRDNMFYGAISSSNTMHPFSRIRIFDISNNNFSGLLPATYIKEFKGMMKIDNDAFGLEYMEYTASVTVTWEGNNIELQGISTSLTILDLSNNMFDGEIPKVIGGLFALRLLNLSHNRINGSIPHTMGYLKNLEWLDLSSNKLVGEIPLALTNLIFLSLLNLSQNQLEGMIPRGGQFDTFSSGSYERNLGLCGVPLLERCTNYRKLPPFNEKFGIGGKLIAFGYGCVMVFGMLMGYIVLSIGKPYWLVRILYGKPK